MPETPFGSGAPPFGPPTLDLRGRSLSGAPPFTVPMQLAVFASGGGSNLEAILQAIEAGRLPARVVLVVADRDGIGALARARRRGLPTAVLPPADFPDSAAFARALLGALAEHGAGFVALAGYLRKIPPEVVEAFRERILNVHPALLPAFGGPGFYGRRVHEAVLAHGATWSGATVHLVDEAYDAGPVVLQEPVPVHADDTADTLAARVLEVEHRLLPEALRLFAEGRVLVEGRRVRIRPEPKESMTAAKPLPPPEERPPVRRALLSVSDKRGLAAFARRLAALGIELVSTGGTARALREAGLAVTEVAAITSSPEILGGRVKTLHPKVHGGLLARRNHPEDLAQLDEHAIPTIDLVVVNLYPFAETVARPDVTDALATENIDIGGPTMLRAAAKNFAFVAPVTSPADYDAVAREIEAEGGLALATRRRLARAAFAHTAEYDAAIVAYLERDEERERDEEEESPLPETLALRLPRARPLRYGENPHQAAALYGAPERAFRQLHGRDLSFNNLLDLSAALDLIREFEEAAPTVAILKHTNPCGVGTAERLQEAYRKAFATDRQSPFGGVVVANRPLDLATAEALDAVFTEIVIAPSFEAGALAFLQEKANRRLVAFEPGAGGGLDVRTAAGGLLVQEPEAPLPGAEALRAGARVVTERAPTEAEWADLDFAWRVAKHVKSNAIVYARGGATLGIGAGQMSRVDASEIAVMKAAKSGLSLEGAAVASDAFFPFADGLVAAAEAGARAVIQPGGSVRDEEVVAAADARGLAMVFTGRRHFRH